MNMHFFLLHIYLLSLGLIAWRQLRSSLIVKLCTFDRIAKENISKISLSTLFQLYFQQF